MLTEYVDRLYVPVARRALAWYERPVRNRVRIDRMRRPMWELAAGQAVEATFRHDVSKLAQVPGSTFDAPMNTARVVIQRAPPGPRPS